LPQDQQAAKDVFVSHLKRVWQQIEGRAPDDNTMDQLLRITSIISFDFGGSDRTAAVETVAHVLARPAEATGAFDVLTKLCAALMSKRLGADASGFRQGLLQSGIRLVAAPSFAEDVAQLRGYSDRVQTHLNHYEETRVGDIQVKIVRPVVASVTQAALHGSLLIVGEPGAGKSAVVSAAANELQGKGHDVLELAVDRLQVESIEGLKEALELDHSLTKVLLNWPGDGPAFLFIDALDATRGGASEAVFRELIREVLELPDNRWRVVASIRTFDLRLGQQFRELFKGTVPHAGFSDPTFPGVRHIQVPPWSESELEDFLRQAPGVAQAIQTGGSRLRALASVPFNTRLLADLVTDGLDASKLNRVTTQSQLLDLYWQYRVTRHGTGSELCLTTAVTEMVNARTLTARKLDVAKSNVEAFDKMLHESVLVLLRHDQHVAVRHHILFDYAASRLYLRSDDIDVMAALLQSERSLGLMLAPALAFMLQDLWSEPRASRARFWTAIARISGDQQCDPIARSVAARMGAELPAIREDVDGLVATLSADVAFRPYATRGFAHVVGALAVRNDDKQPIEAGPWTYLAAAAATVVNDVIWALRTLIFLLIERPLSEPQRAEIGKGARAILEAALAQPNISSNLTAAAIDFVGATYATDAAASRYLLRQLMARDRFEQRGDKEIPSLTRKIGPISKVDPDFAVEIYQVVFGQVIDDDSKTSLGDSQILPLLSNRRQDYDMARFSLKEFFPRFLDASPLFALSALIHAMTGYIAREHATRQPLRHWTVSVGGDEVGLKEDLSHVWAWNPNEEHADNVLSLLKAFLEKLGTADAETARRMTQYLIRHNELAVLWTRLFLVASERSEDIGDLLWPIATTEPFLICADTTKDALDFVAARYPFEAASSRDAFEKRALMLDFSFSSEPERSRTRFLQTLFSCVGEAHLASDEAKAFLPSYTDQGKPAPRNRRPFEMTSGWTKAANPHWWFDAEVDVKAPENASLLTEADRVKEKLGTGDHNAAIEDLPAALRELEQLRAVAEQSGAAKDIKGYAVGVISESVQKIAGRKASELQALGDDLNILLGLIDYLAASPFPEPSAEAESSFEDSAAWGSPAPRVEAAHAMMDIMRLGRPYVDHFRSAAERLLGDAYPPVRLQIVDRLVLLWEADRTWMWQLADRIANQENNRAVLKFFANYFLGRTVHHAPEDVERLTFVLFGRSFPRNEKPTEELLEEFGSLVALLWMSHGREAAKEILQRWLADPPTYEPELSHAISLSREALVFKYTSSEARDAEMTDRAQQFAAWTAEAMASGLETYLAEVKNRAPLDAERTRGTMFAKLLNQISDEFYFASGAFRDSQGGEAALATLDAKRAFLSDTHTTLRRIADAGTPATIHHLIELLEFLVPADPGRVFDLVAHSLLGAGKDHGYQFESLGADRFVAVIGLFLADHRELFADEDRRRKLVACLDAFMEAGWPAARRLLYRLPELLQ
jgi:hypothetical protein